MFKILGSDGTEYGPVTTEQLRQWIREGRAGGQTQVKPEGAGGWMPLNTVPEFADVFRAPPLADAAAPGTMPPVVRMIACILCAVAGISAIWQIVGTISLFRYANQNTASFNLGAVYYIGWIIGAACLPVGIVSAIGLLRGREWARRLAIGLSIFLALYGGWGLARTGQWLFRVMADDPQFAFRSPLFLAGQLWSLAVFLFNIATAVILTRKPVRDAFAKKSSAAV